MSEHIPGHWRCPSCGFYNIRSVIHADSGGVSRSTDAARSVCPNDGITMQPVTWAENAEAMSDELTALRRRVAELENTLRHIPIAVAASDADIESGRGALACKGCGAVGSDECTASCWVPRLEAALSGEPTALREIVERAVDAGYEAGLIDERLTGGGYAAAADLAAIADRVLAADPRRVEP